MSFDEESEMPSSQKKNIEDEESSLSSPSSSEEEEEEKEINSRKHTCLHILKKERIQHSTQLEELV